MPGFDGKGPKGTGPLTGRGLGYCVVPIKSSSGYERLDKPYSDAYALQREPFGPLSYGFNPSEADPYSFSFKGGRGRRAGVRGCFFGRGHGFGKRWQ